MMVVIPGELRALSGAASPASAASLSGGPRGPAPPRGRGPRLIRKPNPCVFS